MVLASTLQNFYNNYGVFLASLAQSVQSSSVNTITMTGIQQGSVIASGNININTPSNSNEASSYYSSLQNTVSSGGSIAGMQIQSSTVTVNGGTITPQNQPPNLGLILGISIPVGVLRKIYI